MNAAGQLPPLPLPDDVTWSSMGISCGQELHGGYQSRVFAAIYDGAPVVAKLTDSRMVDSAFGQRLETTALLAAVNKSAVAPIALQDGLVVEVGGWFVVLSPFIDGRTPDVDDEADVRKMATTLTDLHRSLAQLEAVDMPAVAALVGIGELAVDDGWSSPQLLHGDFASANLLFRGDNMHVLDFAECGYGPVEFEIGNSVYMVLFDAVMTSTPVRAERFRAWFVDEYRQSSGREVRDELIDAAIQLRIRALGRWIDEPATAPIGIRTATPAWRESLRVFVRAHLRD